MLRRLKAARCGAASPAKAQRATLRNECTFMHTTLHREAGGQKLETGDTSRTFLVQSVCLQSLALSDRRRLGQPNCGEV